MNSCRSRRSGDLRSFEQAIYSARLDPVPIERWDFVGWMTGDVDSLFSDGVCDIVGVHVGCRVDVVYLWGDDGVACSVQPYIYRQVEHLHLHADLS